MSLNLNGNLKLHSFELFPISGHEFKAYISSQTGKQFFYWHFSSNLTDFNKYRILYGLKMIGVICMKQDSGGILVDLLLGDKFRRQGKGTNLIIELKKQFRNLIFNVSGRNMQSQAFFNTFHASMISKNESVITYQFK